MQITDKMIQDGRNLNLLNENTYLPEWKDIPEEFKTYGSIGSNKWVKFHTDWFYSGVSELEFFIKPEFSSTQEEILQFLHPMMCSFSSKHEHKTAGIAYLLSLILTDIKWTVHKPDNK